MFAHLYHCDHSLHGSIKRYFTYKLNEFFVFCFPIQFFFFYFILENQNFIKFIR